MDKQIAKYPYKEMPLSNKNEWSSHTNMDESQNNSAEWKEPRHKRVQKHDSIYIKLEKMQVNLQ